MQKFVLLQPGDWPCQFYCCQIIYHCFGKFHRSSSQLTNTLQETLFTSNDHSFYSYPTGNYVCNMTRQTMSQQSSILSIVPTTGPLHISLNSREHIVNSFQPFFKSVYQSIFPNSKLADKPKPWRVSLILEIVYGGWTLIQQTVMQKFCQFKDPQYGTLLNLVITIRCLLFGSTCVYTGEIIHCIFINCSKITLLFLMNIQLKIHTAFCEHKQSTQTLLMNYAKKQRLFFSLRKNSLTLNLSSHHQNSFCFPTISFNFLELNVPKYSQIW